MKVVLFCGGFGMRLRSFSGSIPKPLVRIGDVPIMVHIMKYYASFGHKDFILCLGWKGDVIKDYFVDLQRQAQASIPSRRNPGICLKEFSDWNIRFEETGLTSSIGERMKQLEPILRGEEYFYANYTDGLCNVDLNELTAHHQRTNAVASFVSVKPTHSFHVIESTDAGKVTGVNAIVDQGVWMNGGFFVLNSEFFSYLNDGEELIEQPFDRLIEIGRLNTYRHSGFWSCMDTYKEMQELEEMHERGNTPWQIWNEKYKPVFRPHNAPKNSQDGAVKP